MCKRSDKQSRKQTCRLQGAEDLYNGNQDIHLPEGFGGLRNPWFEFVHYRTGNLGLVKLHAANPQKREDRDGKKNNPHPAKPLGQAPPEKDSFGKAFDIGDYRGSGGRKSGNRLKKGVGKIRDGIGENKRKRTEQPGHDPSNGYNGDSVTVAEVVVFLFLSKKKQERPIKAVMNMDRSNARVLPSLYRRETSNGSAMETPRKKIRIAVKRVMIRKCIRSIPASP